MTTFEGPEQVTIFRALAIRTGIKMYRDIGIVPNRNWTITKMLRAAGEITGEHYKRGQYDLAIAGLEDWTRKEKSNAI